MAITSYIEMRPGEQWRDVTGAFLTYCAMEVKLDRCGCHEGDADGAPSDGKRYAANAFGRVWRKNTKSIYFAGYLWKRLVRVWAFQRIGF